jgi:hypothetical protein
VSGWVYLAAPTEFGGAVYIGTDNGTLHAISVENGTERWVADIGGRLRGTPLVIDDRIYVISSDYRSFIPIDGRLHALSMDGEELWNATIGPTGSSPTILADLIIVGADDGLHAFNNDGTTAWTYTDAGKISASPVATRDAIYIMNNVNDSGADLHTSIISLGPNGDVLWSRVLEPHNWALSSVAIADGRAYAFTDAGWAYSVGDTPLIPDFEIAVDMADVALNDTTDGTATAIDAWEWDIPGHAPVMDQNASARFTESGYYNVSLTVTDEYGRQATTTREVTIELPELNVGFSFTIDDKEITFIANDTGLELTAVGWNWSIAGIDVDLRGEEVTYRFRTPGDYNVTLTITDEFGREGSTALKVTVEKPIDDGDDSPGPGILLVALSIAIAAIFIASASRRGRR